MIMRSREYNFPIRIELVISNNTKAKGLELAKKYSIPYRVFSSKKLFIKERLSDRASSFSF